MPRRITDDEREAKYVRKSEGCWDWIGARTPLGYGIFTADYTNHYAHRWMYERYIGPPPTDTLDHTCHDPETCDGGPTCPHRHCVNPDHLSPSTRGENARRSSRHIRRTQ